MALLFEVEWMASCGFCNGELWSSYYPDIVINSIVSVEFKLVLVNLEVTLSSYTYYENCRPRIL